jgi:hypothetical protein
MSDTDLLERHFGPEISDEPEAAPVASRLPARRPARSFACTICCGDLSLPCPDCDRLAAELAADLASLDRRVA